MLDIRAATRPATPLCADCDSGAPLMCVVRTDYWLCFRCPGCGNVIMIDNPHALPPSLRHDKFAS
jgi:hypothetical protein